MGISKILFLIVLCGGIISILFSCSIEKRLYNKGFYIQKQTFYSKNKQVENLNLTDVKIEDTTLENASVDDSIKTINEGKTTNEMSDCDTILLVNGDTLFGYASIQTKQLIEIHQN